MCNEKWILCYTQEWPAQWLDWEAPPKHFPKPNLQQKKVTVTVWWLLPLWSTTAFWVLVKPLYLRSMLNKSMRCIENCDACGWHSSTERAHCFSMTVRDPVSHNQHFKSWTNWAAKLCLIHHIHMTSSQLTTTSSTILTTFCRENASTTSRRQKILSKFIKSRSMDFYTTWINKLLIGKNVLIVMVPILISKDVFVSTYNDLKFTVWNCIYFSPT